MKKLKIKIKYWWYKVFYRIDIGLFNTMLPVYGDGRFVSVFRKGDYIDVIANERLNKTPLGTIRLVPYQPNHGVMVEFLDLDGNLHWRVSCDYDMFYKMGFNKLERGK